ncbi:MAG: hypothetical protein V1858_04205 [Candidatus Gottesmanbacteria bacterium]
MGAEQGTPNNQNNEPLSPLEKRIINITADYGEMVIRRALKKGKRVEIPSIGVTLTKEDLKDTFLATSSAEQK